MADNVTLPGAGASVATDDVGGVQFQKVKLDGGGDGLSAPIVAGAQSSGDSLPVVGPTDDFVTVTVSITRPANTTAYAINDCYSDGSGTTFTVANAAKQSGGSGYVVDVQAVCDSDPGTPLQFELILFDSSVTSPADNAAFAISDADAAKVIGKVPIFMEDLGNQQYGQAQNVMLGFTCAGSADLRFLVRVKNSYTPANGEVLTLRFKIQRAT